jgi:hypothetical protein
MIKTRFWVAFVALAVAAPAVQAKLLPRATCVSLCGATISGTCTKTLKSGKTKIKPACKARIIRQCRHNKPVCAPPTTTTTTLPGGGGGGQKTLTLTVPDHGSDLDNGWTGTSHNFPIINGSTLQYQLTCPDGEHCTGTGVTGAGTPNGPTFGAPLPLLAAGVAVCVVNVFHDPTLSGEFDIVTGDAGTTTPNVVHLTSKVYLTSTGSICPKCVPASGPGTIGETGKCQGTSAANPGTTCKINGQVTVAGQGFYPLSSDCDVVGSNGPPTPLDIVLNLTTGQAPTLSGSKPCSGQTADDSCGGTACNAVCTGSACITHDAAGNCIDAKGGISQLCCANNTTVPCFPTSPASAAAGGGSIVRTGHPVVPGDTNGGTFASTFCIAATTTSLINITTGLPGPGALLLPAVATVQ